MDKIPKFRRKPKPPAIETAIDRTVGTPPKLVGATISSPPPQLQLSQHQQLQHTPKPSKIAALKSLRLRSSAKRARDDPSAELPLSPPPPPPPPVLVAQDAVSPRGPLRLSMQPERELETKKKRTAKNSAQSPPILPAFLALSNQDIENKFQELTWIERNRIAQGLRNDDVRDCQWALYKQDDGQPKGMDRYVNIKPWSYNRVKLRVPEKQLDYVNASAILLRSPSDKTKLPLRYIAMQGPTEASFDYVWRMMAEQTNSPAVIVQLTNMVEAGALKCDQYFPWQEEHAVWDLNEGDAWGDGWKAQLIFDSMEILAGGAVEKRKLVLRVRGEGKPRVIWHLLYKRWPDFGVPGLEDMETFLELMRLSRSLSNPHTARVVHCSAGVGRTGTFICLEHLIRELESGSLERHDAPPREGPDLVFDTVDSLRQQRRAMVQGDIQYRFIYQVMRKLWLDKYGADTDVDTTPVAKRAGVAEHFGRSGMGSSPTSPTSPSQNVLARSAGS